MSAPGKVWTCRACKGLNRSTDRACTLCGTVPGNDTASTPTTRTCVYDGAPILASGLCQAAGGYPLGTPCPFSCPVCRKPLEWSGACHTCHGQEHAGDPRCMPGDRYDLFDDHGKPIGDGQHWIFVERGPIKAIAWEQARQVARLLTKFSARSADGPQSIADVFEQMPFRPTTGEPR